MAPPFLPKVIKGDATEAKNQILPSLASLCYRRRSTPLVAAAFARRVATSKSLLPVTRIRYRGRLRPSAPRLQGTWKILAWMGFWRLGERQKRKLPPMAREEKRWVPRATASGKGFLYLKVIN